MAGMTEELYRIGAAARFVGISAERLRQLCDTGKVAHVLDAGGWRLVPKSELERLRAQRNGVEPVAAR